MRNNKAVKTARRVAHAGDGPVIVKRPALVKPTPLSVRAEGETVYLTINGVDVGFHYEDALTVAGWLRLRAKQAKANAGDTSRNWRVLGDLQALPPS